MIEWGHILLGFRKSDLFIPSCDGTKFSAVLLAIIVEKSKKCLDFSVTLLLIHLGSCIWYAGVPTKLDWWIVHVLGTIVMILFGEYLCSLKELSDIPLLEL